MNRHSLSTNHLKLYHFQACPYCARVRAAIDELGLDIELRDIHENPDFGKELATHGGKTQVPSLRIERPGEPVFWMYESQDIIRFLQIFASETDSARAA